MPSPSDLLVAAADRIRDMATHFEGYHGGPEGDDRFADSAEQWAYYNTDRNASVDARAWIAALSPAVAPALERWLRESAESLAKHEPAWRDQPDVFDEPIVRRTPTEVAALVEHHFGAALGLARVLCPELLGEGAS